MADNRHPDHPSLLPFSHSSISTAHFSFSSHPNSRRSRSSPPEFFQLLPAFSLVASEDKSNGNGSLSDGHFSCGKFLLPLSFLRNARLLDYQRLQCRHGDNHRSREAADCGCDGCMDMRNRKIRRCPAEEGEEGEGREKRRRTAGWKVMTAFLW